MVIWHRFRDVYLGLQNAREIVNEYFFYNQILKNIFTFHNQLNKIYATTKVF